MGTLTVAIRSSMIALSLAVVAALIAVPGVAQSNTGPPVALKVFVAPPSEHRSGDVFFPDIIVGAVDAQGNQVPATSFVTVSFTNDSPRGGQLSRPGGLTASMRDGGGLAVFGFLALRGIAGQRYSLAFTAPNLLMTTTEPILITPGVPQELVVSTQPGGARSGELLDPQPTVVLQDSAGNRVTDPYTVEAIPSDGQLLGTTRIPTQDGRASFRDLRLTTTRPGAYRLVFVATAVGSGGGFDTFSDDFVISSGTPQDWGLQGTRTTVRGKKGIRVTGTPSIDLIGQRVVPYYKFPGQSSFRPGASRPLVTSTGEFRYQRRTGKKIYLYFATEDGSARSERITIRR